MAAVASVALSVNSVAVSLSSVSISSRGQTRQRAVSLSLSSSSAVKGQALISRLPAARQQERPQQLPVMAAAGSVVVAAEKTKGKPKKKVDSAVKRAKQAEAHRVYNKSRKTEMSTRMKKVFKALEDLRKSTDAKPEDLIPVEKLISEAFAIIDKSVKVGTIHANKGANRKSRLSRAKRAVAIAQGWYTPAPAEASA